MDLFYISNFIPEKEQLILSSEESHHARKVLRKKRGDTLQLTDGKGHFLSAIIEGEKGSQLILNVRQQEHIDFPSDNLIEIALSTIRPKRLDWAVEKLTELGVQTIVPLHCRYTSYRSVKSNHLYKIAISAMKQSEQFYVPEIKPVVTFEQWIQEISRMPGRKFLAHWPPEGHYFNSPIARQEKVFIAVGPEGGFQEDEIQQAQKAGCKLLSLGPTILRTETAAVAAVIRLKILKNL